MAPAKVLQQDYDLVTRDAAHLSAVEIALGSLAHALHIPFAGHILSLNQGAFLAHASIRSKNRKQGALATYEISGVAAALKSLSPTSKKIGPMLSIMIQGLLFSLGLLTFGRRRMGQLIGMALLCSWAFLQPLISLVVSIGPSQTQQIIKFYGDRLQLDYAIAGWAVLDVILVLYLIKVLVGTVVISLLYKMDEDKWSQWQRTVTQYSNKIVRVSPEEVLKPQLTPARGALKDLASPLFLFSFVLTWIFLFIQKESNAEFVWQALRPVAVAFVIFYLLRSPVFFRWVSRIVERFGILKPIQRRLQQVQDYRKS